MRVLLLVLLPRIVFASDAPVAISAEEPTSEHILEGTATVVDDDKQEIKQVLLPEGLFFNKPASSRVRAFVNGMQTQNTELTAENAALKKKVDELAAKPTASFTAFVICILLGIGLGATTVFMLKK